MSTLTDQWVENTTFGPPSKSFQIKDFLKESTKAQERISAILHSLETPQADTENDAEDDEEVFEPIPDELKPNIEAECSLDDVDLDLRDTFSNPKFSEFVEAFHNSWRWQEQTSDKHLKGKSKIQPEAAALEFKRRLKDPQVGKLHESLKSVQLQSWSTSADAHYYVRGTMASDKNILSTIKPSGVEIESSDLPSEARGPVALITYKTYSRGSVAPQGFRIASQHIAHSSQSLGDIWDKISCDMKSLPTWTSETEQVVQDETLEDDGPDECAICIEEAVYGDFESTSGYGSRMKDWINRKGPGVTTTGGSMYGTKLDTLTFCLHKPYWLLHQGDCEHLIVFDQIRLPHPTDPRSGYPILLQKSPSYHYLCRICERLTATLSIVGDLRIGEAVAPVCSSCWKALGEPDQASADLVTVVPLV